MYTKLSIIIPVYNERKTILEILKRIDRVKLDLEKEIIIVDDCSTDGTTDILKGLDRKQYKIIFKSNNEGKGGSIKTGLKEATGEIVIFQDADLEYDPEDYSAMIKPIIDKKTEIVLGIRLRAEHAIQRRKFLYWLSLIGNQAITWTTNLLYSNSAGEYEGCYKAFTKRLLDSIEVRTNNFDFENELVCKILKRGYKTVDVAIHYYPREYNEGKKINWKHGFLILWTIIRCRLK